MRVKRTVLVLSKIQDGDRVARSENENENEDVGCLYPSAVTNWQRASVPPTFPGNTT
jgi:hypothetical protein